MDKVNENILAILDAIQNNESCIDKEDKTILELYSPFDKHKISIKTTEKDYNKKCYYLLLSEQLYSHKHATFGYAPQYYFDFESKITYKELQDKLHNNLIDISQYTKAKKWSKK